MRYLRSPLWWSLFGAGLFALLVVSQAFVADILPHSYALPAGIMGGAVVVGIVGLLVARYSRRARVTLAFGLRKGDLFWVPFAYAAIAITPLVMTLVTKFFTEASVKGNSASFYVPPTDAAPRDWLLVAVTTVALVLFAPFGEEIIFRGYLFGGVVRSKIGRTRLGRVSAAILVSLLFASVHFFHTTTLNLVTTLITIFVMSMSLCWLRLKTGRIGAGIVTHMTLNAISSAITIIMG